MQLSTAQDVICCFLGLSNDGRTIVWSVQRGESQSPQTFVIDIGAKRIVDAFEGDAYPMSDGRRYIVVQSAADRSAICIYTLRKGNLHPRIAVYAGDEYALSSDEKLMAVCHFEDAWLDICQIDAHEEWVGRFGYPRQCRGPDGGGVTDPVFSSRSRFVAAEYMPHAGPPSIAPNIVLVWNLEDPWGSIDPVASIRPDGTISSFAIVEDTGLLLTSCRTAAKGELQFWDLKTAKEVFKISTDTHHAPTMSVSPDEELLAVGTRGVLQLWSLKERRVISEWAGMTPIEFSPDGKWLLVMNDSGPAVWSVEALLKDNE